MARGSSFLSSSASGWLCARLDGAEYLRGAWLLLFLFLSLAVCLAGGCGSPSRSRARSRVCLVSRTSTPRTSTPAGVSGLPGAPGLRGAPAGPPQLTPPPRRAGTSTIQEPRPHPARRTPEPAGVPPGYPPAAGRRARARPGAPRSIPWRPGRSNTGARGPTGVPCQLSRFRCQPQAACQLVLVVRASYPSACGAPGAPPGAPGARSPPCGARLCVVLLEFGHLSAELGPIRLRGYDQLCEVGQAGEQKHDNGWGMRSSRWKKIM